MVAKVKKASGPPTGCCASRADKDAYEKKKAAEEEKAAKTAAHMEAVVSTSTRTRRWNS